jgi:hypothetical protein
VKTINTDDLGTVKSCKTPCPLPDCKGKRLGFSGDQKAFEALGIDKLAKASFELDQVKTANIRESLGFFQLLKLDHGLDSVAAGSSSHVASYMHHTIMLLSLRRCCLTLS